MVTTQIENEKAVEWLKLARKRISIPPNIIKIEYQADVDLLFIKFTDKLSVSGDMDYENNVIYSYDRNGEVVGVEILDFYDIFAEV
jgi:uncharacterized protein YuzE